jgi:hypothetical protein
MKQSRAGAVFSRKLEGADEGSSIGKTGWPAPPPAVNGIEWRQSMEGYSFGGTVDEWWLVINHCLPSHL